MENTSPPSVLGKRTRDNVPEQQSQDENRLFQCGDCRKSYSRVDHLARHVRLHTKEKPYVCQICNKSFARADLLKRHVAGHEARGEQSRNSAVPNRQGRVSKACEACSELHIRCDDQKPCTRCNKKQITCIYQTSPAPPDTEAVARDLLAFASEPVRNVSNATGSEPPLMRVQSNNITNQLETPSNGISLNFMASPPRFQPVEDPMIDLNGFVPDSGSHQMLDPAMMRTSNEQTQTQHQDSDGAFLHDFLQSIIGGDPFPRPLGDDYGHGYGTWTPRNVFDFGTNTSLELNDLDLNFLDDYNQQIPFASFVETPETVRSISNSEPPSALGAEFLQKSSTWRFRPARQDNSVIYQQNIALPDAKKDKRLPVHRRVTTEVMSYTMRDRMMAFFMTATRGENIQRAMLSFPSLELLDSLIQYFLSSKASITNRLIHIPTFRPNNSRPELLAAMVVGGATLCPDVALRKMGFALMESIRLGVPQAIEQDNTLIENIECITSLGICLSIGFWSGNSRKMEIAESFLQPYVTMCRRRGWLRRAAYETIVPLTSDQGKVLEDKWQAWSKQESRKRLVFYFFEHDTRQSITLHTNPLVSYAELGLPLPGPEVLWLASSAEKWKQAYMSMMSQHQRREPSLPDLLQDVELLGDNHGLFDEATANQAVLSAAWRLIWEYRQMCSISLGGQTSSWSNAKLLLSSRLTELTKLLDCVKMSSQSSVSMTLFSELLLMHLHVSLEEVHLFAGAEGHTEARRVFPLLQEWAKSSGARQGVHHAAKIVAAARKVPTACLRDFHAIALYQAGLALWSYGVISNAALVDLSTGESAKNPFLCKRNDEIALLDEVAENGNAQRFVAMNKGQAAITVPSTNVVADLGAATTTTTGSHKSHVLISDPGAVMSVLMDVFRGNGRPHREAPPLVDNLLQLMDGLRLAVLEPGGGGGG